MTSRTKKTTLITVVIFSFFVNAFMLTGPMYMLQVYDRVLSSRSIDTLVTLTILMAAIYVFMGVFDHLRSRILTRHGLQINSEIRDKAQKYKMPFDETRQTFNDGDLIARAFALPAMLGAMDVIWTPLFLIFLYMLHPYICLMTVAGLLISLALASASAISTKRHEKESQKASGGTQQVESELVRDVNTLNDLALWEELKQKWADLKQKTDATVLVQQDVQSGWSTSIKTFRLFFQSSVLGMGAYLAITGALSPGAMIAGSILAGRALAPLDQVISGLPLLFKARKAWNRTENFFEKQKDFVMEQNTVISQPHLDGANIILQNPGQKPILSNLNFSVEPGHCLAVLGDTGAGKTALTRLCAGVWAPTAGTVTLDGHTTHQLSDNVRKAHIGYLPQNTQLPTGSVIDACLGQNKSINPENVYETAKKLNVHEMLTELPDGYETQIKAGGHTLPMTVRRAILLVQAFVGDKKMIVLDDPSAHLPPQCILSVTQHIKELRKKGITFVLVTDNLDVLVTISHIMVLDKGRMTAFGEAVKVVDRYISAEKENTPNLNIPFALRAAMQRRVGSNGGQHV